MSNKEFEEKYIKDNRTEDEKMLDIIHNQAKNVRMNELMDKELKRIERQKREKRNDKITFIIAIVLIVGILTADYFITKAGVESCVAGGHSESWCIVNG